ncbi:MAG: protein jag [Clostridiales bacterium]|nr:protein jag [Clostridiales bacterium]
MEFIKFSAKNVEAAITQAAMELHATSEELEIEVLDKGSAGLFGLGSKPAVIQARKKFTLEGTAEEFLDKVFKSMNMDVSMDAVYNEEEKTVEIDLKGDDMGILIGKRGQTLDSLQYLTSLIVNKYTDEYIRVKLDIENYRERRKETLETLARNIAYKVKRTKHPVSLEPMNPYERRVIHSSLQNDKYVATRSEGEEPYRHVVIYLKKERKEYSRDYGKGYRRNYRKDYYKADQKTYSDSVDKEEVTGEE